MINDYLGRRQRSIDHAANDVGDDLHLLLDVPQLLFKLLRLGLVGCFDVLEVGDPDLEKRILEQMFLQLVFLYLCL